MRAGRNRLITAAVLGALIAGAGVLTGILFASGQRHPAHPVRHHHPSGIQVALGVALVCIGIALAVLGTVRIVRARQGGPGRTSPWRTMWGSPLMALRLSERRTITRQIMGKRPTDPATLDISRDVAARLTRVQQSPLALLGIAVAYLGNALLNPSPVRFILVGLYVVLAVAASTLTPRPQRKARAFLDHNPQPEQETPAATPG